MLITENYEYLFSTEKPQGYDQLLRFVDSDGKAKTTSFSYKTFSAGNEIRMEINFPLGTTAFAKNEIYKLTIVNVPKTTVSISSNITSTTRNLADSIQVNKQQAEGTLAVLEEKELYNLFFRTSSYSTFKEKMAAIPNSGGVVWQEYPHVYILGSNISDASATPEVFDFVESNTIAPDESMVKIVPIYGGTAWYNNKVSPLIYGNTEVLEKANMTNLKPPVNAEVVRLGLRTPDVQLSESVVQSNSRPYVSAFGAINYRASYFIDRDFVALRNSLANSVLNMANASSAVAKFLNENNIPDLVNGAYELQFSYVLPGKKLVTSSVTRSIQLSGFKD